jgi:hypothetical protein
VTRNDCSLACRTVPRPCRAERLASDEEMSDSGRSRPLRTAAIESRVVEQMLVDVATRQHAGVWSRPGADADIRTRGLSKSAVSRRFVATTAAQLDAWQSTSIDAC